jgi:hypothetical protein
MNLRFRAEIGLPPAAGNPLVDGHSPSLVLATETLVSHWLGGGGKTVGKLVSVRGGN